MNVAESLKNALDQAKDKASDLADRYGDRIGAALDRASSKADKATKGRYSGPITSGRDKAKAALGHLAERRHPHRV